MGSSHPEPQQEEWLTDRVQKHPEGFTKENLKDQPELDKVKGGGGSDPGRTTDPGGTFRASETTVGFVEWHLAKEGWGYTQLIPGDLGRILDFVLRVVEIQGRCCPAQAEQQPRSPKGLGSEGVRVAL